jgi:dihydrofolate reductase
MRCRQADRHVDRRRARSSTHGVTRHWSPTLSKLRVQSFSVSLDGYAAGPDQDLQNPLGVGGPELMEWFFPTRTWRTMNGHADGETGVDERAAHEGFQGVGAWILGRNMFGPIRGPWPDESWRGWWGEEPPYHVPVFVLTHHARAPLRMAGGTEFRFVTDGIESAWDQAREAAHGQHVRLGGGVATIRQYLQARLIDDLHLVMRPVLLGSGESLLSGLDLRTLGYQVQRSLAGERANHVYLRRT